MTPIRTLTLWASLVLASAPLWAQPVAAPATPDASSAPATRVGDATHSLLQRQREGRDASAVPRPVDGPVAERSHQRYLQTFDQPVPAWFGSRLERK